MDAAGLACRFRRFGAPEDLFPGAPLQSQAPIPALPAHVFDYYAVYWGVYGLWGAQGGSGVHLKLPGARILPGNPGGLRITQR